MNRLKTEIRTLGCAIFLLGWQSVHAAVINAASGTEAAVTAAIAQASPGDTVQIPAGTWTWTSGKIDFSGITLAGAGTNATFIVDNLPNAWGNFGGFLSATPKTNVVTRLTGITFMDTGAGIQSYKGKVLIDNRAYNAIAPWRIDHCLFLNLNGNNIFPYGNGGLIDHCTFLLRAEAVSHYGLSVNPANPWNAGDPQNDSWGDLPYYNQPKYGSTNALYIESCYFTNYSGLGAPAVFDGYAGSESVFRDNVLFNCAWYNHGNDTSGRYRSTRRYEIYDNTFLNSQNWVAAMDFRGGTGVVFSNSVSGFKLFNTIENYRNVQPNSPFGGVDGVNTWDKISPTVYFTGVNTVSGGKVTCPGANWTPHQWKGYVVRDPQASSIAVGHGAGTVNFCLIQDNTADTLFMIQPKDFQIVFNVGDVFNIYLVEASLDQVGRGSGERLSDASVGSWPNSVSYTFSVATRTNSWPNQALEPLYSWNNTMNGTPSGISSPYPNIQEGRDIYFNTSKPGYTPYAFPHPLVTFLDGTNGSSGSGGGGSGTNTTGTNALPPVSGLRYFIR